MIMPITTGILRLPNSELTTGGMPEKKLPLPKPFRTTKTARGPTDVERGHTRSKVNAFSSIEIKSVLTGPNLSHMTPQTSLPIAEARLNAATRAAPAVGESPRLAQYSGRKNGATRR